MILIDYSQISIANVAMALSELESSEELNESFMRHMILNSIRAHNQRFKSKYGKPYICVDCRKDKYWRKKAFPHYKANRKSMNEVMGDDNVDWEMIFNVISEVKDVLKAMFGYHVIQIDGAEADDIIGVLASRATEPTIIVSSDGDFKQLQINKNVTQYSPQQNKFVKCKNPAEFLKEHIIRGDKGDGIPNILSAEDAIVNGVRQSSVYQKKLDVWMDLPAEDFCESDIMLDRWKLNQSLIDLSYTPHELVDAIIKESAVTTKIDHSAITKYFMEHKMKYLYQELDTFF